MMPKPLSHFLKWQHIKTQRNMCEVINKQQSHSLPLKMSFDFHNNRAMFFPVKTFPQEEYPPQKMTYGSLDARKEKERMIKPPKNSLNRN